MQNISILQHAKQNVYMQVTILFNTS